jgi:hypothetical protein
MNRLARLQAILPFAGELNVNEFADSSFDYRFEAFISYLHWRFYWRDAIFFLLRLELLVPIIALIAPQ